MKHLKSCMSCWCVNIHFLCFLEYFYGTWILHDLSAYPFQNFRLRNKFVKVINLKNLSSSWVCEDKQAFPSCHFCLMCPIHHHTLSLLEILTYHNMQHNYWIGLEKVSCDVSLWIYASQHSNVDIFLLWCLLFARKCVRKWSFRNPIVLVCIKIYCPFVYGKFVISELIWWQTYWV